MQTFVTFPSTLMRLLNQWKIFFWEIKVVHGS